jgi:hypothetical protein
MPKILQILAALAAVEKKKTGRKTHLKETTSVGSIVRIPCCR